MRISGNRGKGQSQIVACTRCTALESVCVHIPADRTLPLRLQGSEHDDDRVVPGWGLDEATELVPVHPDDRTPGGPLHHLVNLLWQQILDTQTGRGTERTEHRFRIFRFKQKCCSCSFFKMLKTLIFVLPMSWSVFILVTSCFILVHLPSCVFVIFTSCLCSFPALFDYSSVSPVFHCPHLCLVILPLPCVFNPVSSSP